MTGGPGLWPCGCKRMVLWPTPACEHTRTAADDGSGWVRCFACEELGHYCGHGQADETAVRRG